MKFLDFMLDFMLQYNVCFCSSGIGILFYKNVEAFENLNYISW